MIVFIMLLNLILVVVIDAIDIDDLVAPNDQSSTSQMNASQASSLSLKPAEQVQLEALNQSDLKVNIKRFGNESPVNDDDRKKSFMGGAGGLIESRSVVFRSKDQIEIELELMTNKVSEDQKPKKLVVEVGDKRHQLNLNDLKLSFPAAEIISPQLETSNKSYLVFKTTESKDSKYFLRALHKTKESGFVPHEKIAFYDDHQFQISSMEGSNLMAENTYKFDPKEIFDAGGLEIGKVQIFDGKDRLISEKEIAVEKSADWIYYSGHYTWIDGGTLGGGGVNPWEIEAKNWGKHLEVLIMASCYAMDVNDPNGVMESKAVGVRVGVNGSEWWKKFKGTALGYGGVAPSGGVDAEVAARLVDGISKSGINPENKKEYSAKLVQLWMNLNTRVYKANAAAAIDSEGNYYFVPLRGAKIGGVSLRSNIMPWAKVAKEKWEPENQELLKKSKFNEHISQYVMEETNLNRGGRPYSYEEVIKLPLLKEQAIRAEVDPDSEYFRNMLTKMVEYQAHVFYDIPDVYKYEEAAYFLAINLTEDRPVRVDELRAHFTHPTQPNRSKYLSESQMRKIVIREFVVRMVGREQIQNRPTPSADKLIAMFKGHLKLSNSDVTLVKRTVNQMTRMQVNLGYGQGQATDEIIMQD